MHLGRPKQKGIKRKLIDNTLLLGKKNLKRENMSLSEKTLNFINNDCSNIVVTEIVNEDDKQYSDKLETENIELE